MRSISKVTIIPTSDGHFDVQIEETNMGHSVVKACGFGEMLEQVAILLVPASSVEARSCYREEAV